MPFGSSSSSSSSTTSSSSSHNDAHGAAEREPHEAQPLLEYMNTSRAPLAPSRVEMSLYQDVAVGVDGKGGQAGTFLRAKRQSIVVLNCSLIAHAVVLLPQLLFSFLTDRWNVMLEYLDILVVLNLLCTAILLLAEYFQVRAMRAPLTFRRHQQIVERVSTGLLAALTVGAAVWICLLAMKRLHDPHFLLVFSHRDAMVMLGLSSMIFVTGLGGLVFVAALILPKYKALWTEHERSEKSSVRPMFDRRPAQMVSSSTQQYAKSRVQKGCIAHTKWSLGILLVPVVLEMLQSLFNALIFVASLAMAQVQRRAIDGPASVQCHFLFYWCLCNQLIADS
eukprot:INCI2730.1.p1 GENE.INCI2730.1~~INCI2730.1.p1  ORF type:complete len:336 (+),score=40.83 INCI2730.1:82-1089(+)